MTIRVGDPVRYFGDIESDLFGRYLGRVVRIDDKLAKIQLGQIERIFPVEEIIVGMTAPCEQTGKRKIKYGGMGFGATNAAVRTGRVSA